MPHSIATKHCRIGKKSTRTCIAIWMLCIVTVVIVQFMFGLGIHLSFQHPDNPQQTSLILSLGHNPNQNRSWLTSLQLAADWNQSNVTHEIYSCWRTLVTSTVAVTKPKQRNLNKKQTSCAKDERLCCYSKSLWIHTHSFVSDIVTHISDTNIELTHLLRAYAISYHKMVYLRRALIIIQSLSQSRENRYPKPNMPRYHEILNLTAFILNEIHSQQGRHRFPFYNIHIPQSSGVRICASFKRIATKQQSAAHMLRRGAFNLVTNPTKHCNFNGSENFMTEYALNLDQNPLITLSCHQQYGIVQKYNFNIFVARESPMNPPLCDRFVYIFVVRSPIERIVSFMSKLGKQFFSPQNESKWANFYASFLNRDHFAKYRTRKSDIRYNTEIQHEWRDAQGEKHWFKALWYTKFVHSFMNNAVTRWMGFNSHQANHTFDAMFADEEEIKSQHFHRAIHLMMKTDYVLASSTFMDGELRTDNEIHQMYQYFNTHVYRHLEMEYIPAHQRYVYKMNTNVSTGHSQRVINHLTDHDFAELYKHNKYDMQLYKLAKMITKADSRFYSLFNMSV